MQELCRLTYVSRTQVLSLAKHRRLVRNSILEDARLSNGLSGVTGVLLCGTDHFFQVLEGSFTAVTETMKRIRRDERHHDVHTLTLNRVSERRFAGWALADVDLSVTSGALMRATLERAHAGNERFAASLYRIACNWAGEEGTFSDEPRMPPVRDWHGPSPHPA